MSGADRRAFFVDSSACSGCKACQMACKDKNDLAVGVLWRRVYEIAGGGWRREGGLWVPDLRAYNLSLACNHCEDPACVRSCPTRALTRREDGLVLLDVRKCVGCRYCEWSCPYGAPRYDAARGVMTKCDMCADLLAAGGRPACVEACPMRALDFGGLEELRARHGGTAEVLPLPPESMTRPSLLIRPHPAAAPPDAARMEVANDEEV